MRRFVPAELTPSKLLPSVIAVALVAGLIVTAPARPQPAAASNAYDATLNITFPLAGPNTYTSSFYSGRSGGRSHRAVDIMAPAGATVHAAVGGTITLISGVSSELRTGGYMIRIAGDDGRDYWYIHLGRQDGRPSDAYAPGLKRGTRVERGQWIGLNGCSGNASCNAPHLHFEIHDSSVDDPTAVDGLAPRMDPFNSLRAAQRRGDVPTGVGRFQDVAVSNGHRADIEWLADQGITRGCNPPANTRFCPANGVKRSEMAAFLSRSLNLTKTSGIRFRDVPRGSTFETDIDRLATAGITVGCNPPANDRFCPDRVVSRQEMAAFMSRGYKLPAGSGSFRDVARGSTFEADIGRLANAGVTRGCNPPTNDRFCPSDPVTRAQMASFIRRAS